MENNNIEIAIELLQFESRMNDMILKYDLYKR